METGQGRLESAERGTVLSGGAATGIERGTIERGTVLSSGVATGIERGTVLSGTAPAGIERGTVDDIPAIILRAGAYSAAICPAMGANCFRLEYEGASLLRTPPSFAVFHENPNVFGMPLLFPPNRIRGGKFVFQGRTYSLPVNETARGHHIHGFLSSTLFRTLEDELAVVPGSIQSSTVPIRASASCRAAFSFEATKDSPYSSFPHAFRVELSYSLDSNEGLSQRLEVENRGDSDMPLGLGFHTAFNCPFIPGTAPGDYRLRLAVSSEILLDPETIIPTGKSVSGNELIAALRGEGIPPQGRALSSHFRGSDASSREASPREAVLSHVPTGRSIVYRVDPIFAFWTLWNQGGDRAFVCPEPQTWMIDAPNSALPPEESGFRFLAPGESIALTSTIRVIQAREENA
jgi:aldose 1-epimerase